MPATTTSTMLTTSQVATRLGVTVRRVQALITAGRLPAERLGRDWLIQEHALAAVQERTPGRPRKGAEQHR